MMWRTRAGLLALSLVSAVGIGYSSQAWASGSTPSSHQQAGTAGTSGNPSSPQPYSNADNTNHGANSTSSNNPYKSTRDGSPSLNGNGNGNATGKPCAGCVGKADNKNPPGQEQSDPMGTFPNNGYECDHNNGIGKTNPAHTGCTGTPPVAPTTTVPVGPTTTTSTTLPLQDQSGSQGESGGRGAAGSLSAGAAGSALAAGAAPARGSLAFTGGDWAALALMALGLLAAGITLLGLSRRSRAA